MIERLGAEQLLSMVLASAPDRALEAIVTASPEDTAALVEVRENLALLALEAEPVAPPPGLRERLLAAHPRPLRPKRPVMLVVDMIIDHLTEGKPIEVPRARDIVPALKKRIARAREKSIPIVYVCDSHGPDDPDFETWPLHAVDGSHGAEVWPDLAPAPGDRIVKKPTYSAFQSSNLGAVLEELGADKLILTGCATELGLHATATEALGRGYVVSIPQDSQAGMSMLAEMLTLITLSAMPPYDPIYMRKR